jgi:hypothetical protein
MTGFSVLPRTEVQRHLAREVAAVLASGSPSRGWLVQMRGADKPRYSQSRSGCAAVALNTAHEARSTKACSAS